MARMAFYQVALRYRSVFWHFTRIHVLFISLFFWPMSIARSMLEYQLPIIGKFANVGVLGPCIASRINLWFYLHKEWTHLVHIEQYWRNDISDHYDWIRLYNASIAITADWILGFIAKFLILNYVLTGNFDFMNITSRTLTTWIHKWTKRKIEWIMVGSPGGLKLNIHAASSLGALIMFYIDRWLITACELSNFTPHIFLLIICSGACGLSMLIAMMYDTIYFLNMQTHWMYKATTKIYRFQLTMLRSLWLLFRGKKRNVLRDRINLCDYGLDQLILGIFLFITTFFLISTSVIFYLLFVYVILLVLLFQMLAMIVITTLNHFPYYLLALYLTNSKLLLTGVYLKPLDSVVKTKEWTLASFSHQPTKLQIRCDVPGDEHVSYYELKCTNTKFWYLFADLKSEIQNIFLGYNVKHILSLILLGHPLERKSIQSD